VLPRFLQDLNFQVGRRGQRCGLLTDPIGFGKMTTVSMLLEGIGGLTPVAILSKPS
jgi:hypothetical protein